MVKIAGEIDFTNIVIEIKLFEDRCDIVCVIADNLKDEFDDKIFVLCTEDRRSLFWKTGALIIVSFVFKQTF